jgi:hypothetical protein
LSADFGHCRVVQVQVLSPDQPNAPPPVALNPGPKASYAAALRGLIPEELQLCREMVILPAAHEALRGLAAVAIVEGDIPHAARLIGAATAHRYGDPQDPVDARLKSTFFDDARTQSGGAWDAAIAEGAAMSLVDAIAHALGEPRAQSRPLR